MKPISLKVKMQALKSECYEDVEIINSLNILYGDELVEIVEDVKDPQNIMQYFNWSNDLSVKSVH